MVHQSDDWDYSQWRANKLQELKYHKIICMLVAGCDVKTIAKETGTSQRTIQRYFNNPEFNENLTNSLAITFKSALAKATLYADKAIQILISIAEDETQPTKYRLAAIQQITNLAFKTADIRDDVSDVQKTLDKQRLLLASYGTVNHLSSDFGHSTAKLLNERNKRMVWEEIYPHEPYPDDENSMKKHYRKNELGIDDDDSSYFQ